MRLSSMEMPELSSGGRRCRDIRRDPSPASLVIAAAGYSDMVSVSRINYAAWWTGYDTEECVQKAMDDGYIEVYCFNPYGARSTTHTDSRPRDAGRQTGTWAACSSDRQ